MSKQNYHSFLRLANILLSGMTGFLIGYPVAAGMTSSNTGSLSVIILTTLAGFITGYRRANSRIFLYFCMLAIIILSVVISSSLQP